MKEKIVCILGMHRSGSSYATGRLRSMGIYLGKNDALIAGDAHNENGYFESRALSQLAEDMFIAFGGDHIRPPFLQDGWETSPLLDSFRARAKTIIEDEFAGEPCWGWKDPRNSVLLPFWEQIVTPTHYLITLRNPLEVAESLQARNGLTIRHGTELWILYVASALFHTRNKNRLIVFFEDARSNPEAFDARLREFLQMDDASTDHDNGDAVKFSTGLVHQQVDAAEVFSRCEVHPLAKAIYRELRESLRETQRPSGPAAAEVHRHTIEAVESELSAVVNPFVLPSCFPEGTATSTAFGLNARLEALTQTISERDRQIGSLNQTVHQRDEEVGRLHAAVSARDVRIGEISRALAQRDDQIGQISQTLAARDNQLADLGQTIAARDSTIQQLNEELAARTAHVAALDHALIGCDGQIANLSHDLAARDAHIAMVSRQLAQILRSNSWRITKPARFVFRTVRHGLGVQDKSQVRLLLRNQYRRLPLPFKLKHALRTAFFRLTGWSSHAPQPQPVASLAGAIQALPTVQPAASMAAAPAVSDQSARQIKPYFGVRRPHGKRRAAILTNQLLDWHDGRPRFGGGERYALELARLLHELDIEVTFFQPSLRSGSGDYYGFEVKLLVPADSVGEFHHGVCSSFTELSDNYDHVYYHLPEYASGIVREDGLMTCHGIWFDHNNYPDSIFRTPAWFEHLYRAFRNPLGIVSVDTNSIGVIRSLWPDLAQKMRFIPNFYDAKSYRPDPAKRNPQRLTILFPRRSQINRGARIFGDIVDRIPHDVDIIWLGEGDPVDTQMVKDVCARDKRASFHVADFDQMPAWYQKADIAVIPTLACEGTSLSCIEALACGCAVISTNVGGLPDVVYDGINGLLVDPETSSLANAINRLIEDKALRERLQRSGAETAGNFELQMWRARWVEVLRGYGWISDEACANWFAKNHSGNLVTHPTKTEKWVVLTRNAIHGGVESLIREEARLLNAPVIVCGGHDRKDTCPFEYSRADDARALTKAIEGHDVILYHWLPDWALEVIRKSRKTAIEFVHRTDTSESDKTVPKALVTHSAFLASFIHETYGKPCRVVDHPIALDHFVPQPQLGPCIGAITSYYETKGIDIFLRAWALLKDEFPEVPVRFYGAGDDLHLFRKLAAELGVAAEFRDATNEPWKAMQEFRCFVVPSRIEGLPVAILEALAMNIPVVASALPGMQEFNELACRRDYAAYVDLATPEDPKDLARVIQDVLKKVERRDSNRYIREYYSPQKHCSDLVSVLREISRH